MELIKADLHNHLRTFTHAKEGDFDLAVDLAYKRLGLGGILGLVNFVETRYELYSQQKSKYGRRVLGNAVYVPEKDILIVKGQEIATKQGHLLVLGLRERKHLHSGRTLEDSLKEAKDNNGIIIADHPFYKEGVGNYLTGKLLEQIDALELNGEASWIPGITPINANLKAINYFLDIKDDFDIGIIANSDGHSFFELGKSFTYFPQPDLKNSETLVSSLRRGIRNAKLEDTHSVKSLLGTYLHVGLLAPLIIGSKLGLIKITNPGD